jgi:hypothetical protein
MPAVYLDVAKKLSNPLLMGPPICEELMAFVRHLFTEEEAGIVRHLAVFRGRSEEDLARAAHRPVQEVRPILHRLAVEKRAIGCGGPVANSSRPMPTKVLQPQGPTRSRTRSTPTPCWGAHLES